MRTEVINTLREISMGPSDVILLNENDSARCSAKIGSAKITILITRE